MIRTVLAAALSFVIAFVGVAAIGVISDPWREPTSSAQERPQGCCVREGVDPDASSAEFQQAVANAIVQSGAELRDFRAPRPPGEARVRRLTAQVTFTGTQQAVAGTLQRFALLAPAVAVGSAELTRDGDRFRVSVFLVQWVRLEQSS